MKTETISSAPAPLLRVLVWSALYALPVAVALLPLLDYDLWWHLRTGQWIAVHGTLPATDPFSQYGLNTGKPWLAYSWLFELLVYTLYRTFGEEGIFVWRALMVGAIVLALHRLVAKRAPHFAVAAVLMILAVLALLPLLTDRPWLITILFGTITLDAILDLRAGRPARRAWLLPLVFALWANLHIQFVYGLFLLGLACLAPVVDRLRGHDRIDHRSWLGLVALTAACVLATLVTPYHVEVYRVVLEYATQRVPLRDIAENQALAFRDPWDWCALLLGASAAFALGRRGRSSAFDLLFLATAAWFAFRGRRDVWFLVLAALAVMTAALPALPAVFWPTRRQALAVAGIVLPLLIAYGSYAASGNHVQATLEAQYPSKAAAFVRERGYRGPLYNHLNWGGYLIWDLPELPVSIDGRNNLHGDERLARSMATWEGRPGWEADPELAAAGVVIAETRTPLTSLLRRDGRFRLVHEDAVAVVFVAAASGE